MSDGPRTFSGTTAGAALYGHFLDQHHPLGTARNFESMSNTATGFGGVVFGNEAVFKPSDLPTAIRFVDSGEASDDNGWIEIDLARGGSAKLGPVAREHAVAAFRMVFGEVHGLGPHRSPEGLGLVGIYNNTLGVVCDVEAGTISRNLMFAVVIHPAIADLDLGWAAVSVDALPIRPDRLIEDMRQRPGGDTGALAVRRLFQSIAHEQSLGTWKVVDVPMEITIEDGIIIVQRREADGYPFALRRASFLDLRAFMEDERGERWDPVTADRFYRILPLLASASSDYASLNQFAGVLGVVRASKAAGVKQAEIPQPSREVRTPAAVAVTADGALQGIEPFDSNEVELTGLVRIETCQARLLEKDLQVATFARRYLESDADTRYELVRDLDGASDSQRFWLVLEETRVELATRRTLDSMGDLAVAAALAGVGSCGLMAAFLVVPLTAWVWRRRQAGRPTMQ